MDYVTASLKVFYDRVSNYFYNTEDKEENYIDKDNIISKDDLITLPHNRIYKKLSTYEQLSWFFSEPTYIIDNIYIGSAYNAANKTVLDKLNIKCIINVTTEINNYFPDNIVYIKYSLYDNNRESIKKYLEDSYKKIKEYQQNINGNILIHCFMGASRSATILAYYLIMNNKMSAIEAYDFIKTKRNLVNPTYKFFNELKEIERN
jgi:hypothetical protein